MERKCTENELKREGEGEVEEEEEEALSLCDLPIISEENQSRKEEAPSPRANEIQEDFDFCSFSKESEMCAADEVFFKGQILPLRNSVSSEKGISRCASMDRCYSIGFTSVSSRSSSIRSHQSSSSGSSSSIRSNNISNNIPRVPNQFHSHPSPTPQVRLSSMKQANVRNSNRKSSLWSIFHVGLVTPPEIALQDLKIRRENSKNNNNFGSRNSTSSNSTSDISNGSNNKKKPRLFDKNGVLFGGCKCSANAVDTVSPRVVFIKRSASENENNVQTKNQQQQQHRTGKQALSRHRTFEWLKQLSLESATDEALLPT
ncbi:hypothetical protein Adt_20388 [Abeliophyllum distichum]|uniref:Uncharacterized protein n=1 Tax=Abeliophyllum distichum TaxID=126358 RepID=A0ABD1SWG1_9LAMI